MNQQNLEGAYSGTQRAAARSVRVDLSSSALARLDEVPEVQSRREQFTLPQSLDFRGRVRRETIGTGFLGLTGLDFADVYRNDPETYVHARAIVGKGAYTRVEEARRALDVLLNPQAQAKYVSQRAQLKKTIANLEAQLAAPAPMVGEYQLSPFEEIARMLTGSLSGDWGAAMEGGEMVRQQGQERMMMEAQAAFQQGQQAIKMQLAEAYGLLEELEFGYSMAVESAKFGLSQATMDYERDVSEIDQLKTDYMKLDPKNPTNLALKRRTGQELVDRGFFSQADLEIDLARFESFSRSVDALKAAQAKKLTVDAKLAETIYPFSAKNAELKNQLLASQVSLTDQQVELMKQRVFWYGAEAAADINYKHSMAELAKDRLLWTIFSGQAQYNYGVYQMAVNNVNAYYRAVLDTLAQQIAQADKAGNAALKEKLTADQGRLMQEWQQAIPPAPPMGWGDAGSYGMMPPMGYGMPGMGAYGGMGLPPVGPDMSGLGGSQAPKKPGFVKNTSDRPPGGK